MFKLMKMSVVAGVAAVLSLSAYASDLGENTPALENVNSAVSVEAVDSSAAEVQGSPEELFGTNAGSLQLASSCGGTLPRYSMLGMVYNAQQVPAAVAAAQNQCASCSASASNAGSYYVIYCN